MSFKIKMTLFVFIFLLIFITLSFSETYFKISGKAVYNGQGVEGINVICIQLNGKHMTEASTDKEGNFSLYTLNGINKIGMKEGKGYVLINRPIELNINNKNVTNVILILEKGCKVSGYVKFEDGEPIQDAEISVENKRSISIASTDENGFYEVSRIKAHEDSKFLLLVRGTKIQVEKKLSLQEGQSVENLNFTFPKKICISGQVVDKDTQEIIKNVLAGLTDMNNTINVVSNEKADGTFYFYNLDNGKYRIVFIIPNYSPYGTEIEYKGTEIKLKIELQKDPDWKNKWFKK